MFENLGNFFLAQNKDAYDRVAHVFAASSVLFYVFVYIRTSSAVICSSVQNIYMIIKQK